MIHEGSTGEVTAEKKPLKTAPKRRRQKHYKSDHSQWFYEQSRDGESALWIAVITQAVLDATSRGTNAEARRARQDAIRWLSDNGKDFTEVCLLAGYDPDYIRKESKRIIISPKRWRAEPGQGKRYHERKAYREKAAKKTAALLPAPHAQPVHMPNVVIAFAWQQEYVS